MTYREYDTGLVRSLQDTVTGVNTISVTSSSVLTVGEIEVTVIGVPVTLDLTGRPEIVRKIVLPQLGNNLMGVWFNNEYVSLDDITSSEDYLNSVLVFNDTLTDLTITTRDGDTIPSSVVTQAISDKYLDTTGYQGEYTIELNNSITLFFNTSHIYHLNT